MCIIYINAYKNAPEDDKPDAFVLFHLNEGEILKRVTQGKNGALA